MKKIIQSFLIIVFFLNITNSFGQISYAKEVVKKLSSKKMHGRGYVKKGDLKAAKYIKKEFKRIGLLKYNDDYFQKFNFSINTQPSNLELKLNDTLKLTPGVEFLIDPSSPSIKGNFTTIHFTLEDILNTNWLIETLKSAKDKVLLIDTYSLDQFNTVEKNKITKTINYLKYSQDHLAAAVLVFSNKKLTWSGSTMQSKKASFVIKKKINLKNIHTVNLNSKSLFIEKYTSQNCIGYLKGTSNTDSTIVISAHYDHLGRMGRKTYFPGANDNASGIALLLNQAVYFSKKENTPKYNMVFIAFGGEEIGLLGSKYFTENPVLTLSKIKFLLNFDLAGTGDEGIKVVNGTEFPKEFNLLKSINKQHDLLKDVFSRGSACNSDHCYFYKKGVPSFFIYTLGGIKAYHDIYDKYETLPFTFFEEYSKLTHLFINKL
tara:strand:+ start:6628 stop:7923 length:1296 start_codon:yes stop_codon:yes gene_type:complete